MPAQWFFHWQHAADLNRNNDSCSSFQGSSNNRSGSGYNQGGSGSNDCSGSGGYNEGSSGYDRRKRQESRYCNAHEIPGALEP